MAQVITIANSKGGVGKTTLTCALAAKFADDGFEVAIIDTDVNQYHSNRWHDKKPHDRIAVRLQKSETTLHADIEHVKDLGFDVILIDTAGWDDRVTIYAITASDLVLIPTKLDEPSVERSFEMVEHVKAITTGHANPADLALVMMDVMQHTSLSQKLVDWIKNSGVRVVPKAILSRVGFKEMLTTGGMPSGKARDVLDDFFDIAMKEGFFWKKAEGKQVSNG